MEPIDKSPIDKRCVRGEARTFLCSLRYINFDKYSDIYLLKRKKSNCPVADL